MHSGSNDKKAATDLVNRPRPVYLNRGLFYVLLVTVDITALW